MSDNQTNSGALHQLLAVRADLERVGNMILGETSTTFLKRQEHFDGVIKTYTPYQEGSDEIPPEVKEIVTTVGEKLNYTAEAVVKALDARVSMEESNASGNVRADLIVEMEDGVKNFGSFSAISLLALEEWLTKIRDVYKNIPTLDPARTWKVDSSDKKGVYKSDPEIKFRSVTKKVPVTLAEATDKFPAQVQVFDESIQVGKYSTEFTSGKITPGNKASILGRIDSLILAVKQAKAKANQAKATQVKVGQELFDFINGGIF